MILKDEILTKVTEKDIMEHYWNQKLKDNKPVYRNPTRGDTKGTCYFRWIRGKYLFHDRARGVDANFDCFQYVMWYYSCSFADCLHRINGDMKLGLTSQILDSKPGRRIKKTAKKRTSRKVNFQVKTRGWRQEDLEYWGQYHISIENLNKVMKPVSSYKSDSGGSFKFTLRYRHNINSPCYIYTFNSNNTLRVKLYQPKSKEAKWRANSNTSDLFGYDHLPSTGDTLYIASGGKDMLCLWEMGLLSIAPQSESSMIPEAMMKDLQARFKKIYVLFDNDTTGIEMAEKFSAKYKLTNIILPKKDEHIKDVAEFVKEFGLANTLNIILDEQSKRDESSNGSTTRTTTSITSANGGNDAKRHEYDSFKSECIRTQSDQIQIDFGNVRD